MVEVDLGSNKNPDVKPGKIIEMSKSGESAVVDFGNGNTYSIMLRRLMKSKSKPKAKKSQAKPKKAPAKPSAKCPPTPPPPPPPPDEPAGKVWDFFPSYFTFVFADN